MKQPAHKPSLCALFRLQLLLLNVKIPIHHRFTKAALRNHQHCKCGEGVGDQKDLSLCDRVCYGDAITKCGRDREHSVYDTQSITLPSYLEDPAGMHGTFYLEALN